MKRSLFALALASAVLAGPVYARDTVSSGATAEWMLANRDAGIDFAKLRRDYDMRNVLAVPAADVLTIDRAAAPAPRLTYAVLVTTTSPSAMAIGLGSLNSPLSIA
jgi:hypothetical protein